MSYDPVQAHYAAIERQDALAEQLARRTCRCCGTVSATDLPDDPVCDDCHAMAEALGVSERAA